METEKLYAGFRCCEERFGNCTLKSVHFNKYDTREEFKDSEVLLQFTASKDNSGPGSRPEGAFNRAKIENEDILLNL